MEQKKELIYGLNDRPPLRETIFAAVQHLLAIFVAIITPPLIISSELQFDLETTGYLISMSLFVSGIATFIQCKLFWFSWCRFAVHSRNFFLVHQSHYRSWYARNGKREDECRDGTKLYIRSLYGGVGCRNAGQPRAALYA